MKISPARLAAFEILSKIETEKAFSSELLPHYENTLATNDRALCHHLTLGVLRKQLFIDWMIDQFVDGKKIDTAVRIALRLGIYQLSFLDKVPNYSAVNESVNLVQHAKKTSAKGLVNAVLRRAARETLTPEYDSETERVSIQTSHPRWLVEKWIGTFGSVDTEKLATANNEIPQIAFRRISRTNPDIKFENTRASDYVDGCLVADRNTTEMIAAVTAGEIYFQDEGSQMVGAAVELTRTGAFLDLCAAPGSKFTQIARRMESGSQLLIGGDLHSHRLRSLVENGNAHGVTKMKIVQYDAERTLPFADGSFDSILVDAPCYGTGTIRHNPELRYSLQSSDFLELAAKQLRLIQSASKLLRKGGTLTYSTCSLESEENEQVCMTFLANAPEFRPKKPNVPDRFFDKDGFARTLPHRDNMDGFFIASFEKA